MKQRILILIIGLAMAAPGGAFAGNDKDGNKDQTETKQNDDNGRVSEAAAVVREFAAMKEGPPEGLVQKAAAVVVIPDLLKAGFGVGGKHGTGVLSVRNADNTWSEPVFVKLSGGSIGWQIGVSSTDLVLLFMHDRNIGEVLDGEFTLGGDINVAAGPIGRQGSAGTDAHFDAEVYSYSRSEGLFAGIAVDGSQLYIDKDAVARYYGGQMKAHDVVRKVPEPGTPGEELASALKSLTGMREATEGATSSSGSK